MKAALLLAALLIGCAPVAGLPVSRAGLAGGPWLVDDIDGGGIIDNVRIDLIFAGDQVTGLAACNRFSGPWKAAGTAVTFGPMATTRMMCSPAVMAMEGKFLAALGAVTVLRFDATGAALLSGADGHRLKLRRETR